MKTIICSDIHDAINNLDRMLAIGNTAGCDALICCGDLCSPFIIDRIHTQFNHPCHIVFGNNDGDRFHIQQHATKANTQRGDENAIMLHGEFLLKPSGKQLIGLPHDNSLAVFHFPETALHAFESNKFDAVFFGHTHKLSIAQSSDTRLINPGSVMGFIPGAEPRFAPPTCVIFNWENNEADVIEF
ncbi:MAG TPA: YfcE family phosphodiesterase [Bacteroidia bacterium]|nr:YfcE family phosphodiesterase [Bacteroidia bacterium]